MNYRGLNSKNSAPWRKHTKMRKWKQIKSKKKGRTKFYENTSFPNVENKRQRQINSSSLKCRINNSYLHRFIQSDKFYLFQHSFRSNYRLYKHDIWTWSRYFIEVRTAIWSQTNKANFPTTIKKGISIANDLPFCDLQNVLFLSILSKNIQNNNNKIEQRPWYSKHPIHSILYLVYITIFTIEFYAFSCLSVSHRNSCVFLFFSIFVLKRQNAGFGLVVGIARERGRGRKQKRGQQNLQLNLVQTFYYC